MPPLRVGEIDFMNPSASITDERIVNFTMLNPLYNISGQPAMSLPLSWNDDGIPIGVMFGAKYGDEATLFRIAGQLEQARPWNHRYTELWRTSDR